jgi:hypothetical protein
MDFDELTRMASKAQNELKINMNEEVPIGFILGSTGSTALGVGIVGFLGWAYWRYRESLINYLRQLVRPRTEVLTRLHSLASNS